MEEHVGLLWHKLISRTVDTRYPEAAVFLSDVRHTLGVFFRALGGDGGLEVVGSNATAHGARRAWLQRIAGTGRKLELAWRDDQTLRLPEHIDLFPDCGSNRDLYLWLAALAVGDQCDEEAWIVKKPAAHCPDPRAISGTAQPLQAYRRGPSGAAARPGSAGCGRGGTGTSH